MIYFLLIVMAIILWSPWPIVAAIALLIATAAAGPPR